MTARSESSNGKSPSTAEIPIVKPGTIDPLGAGGPPIPPKRRAGWFPLGLVSFAAGWGVVGGLLVFGQMTGPIGALLGVNFVLAMATILLALELAQFARRQQEESDRSATRDYRMIEMLQVITRRLDGPAVVTAPPGIDPGVLAIERAIDQADWDLAGSLIEALAIARPDDAGLVPLRERLARGREQAARNLGDELQAARAAGDVERVLELHGLLVPSLDHEAKGALDRELAGWFLDRIQRRLHGGKIQREVVELATKVAESFAATTAGASLRQSLPMLRRAVGLCPRCAGPYLGVAQVCPVCLATAAMTAPSPPPTPPISDV